MKVVIAWLALVALALVAAGSCSIKHQSEQFECEENADCVELGDGRVCSEGLCVVPGGPQKDAATGDRARCSSRCRRSDETQLGRCRTTTRRARRQLLPKL